MLSTHPVTDRFRTAWSLPSMGGREISPVLMTLAQEIPQGQAIVEVGCWLGAGTASLAIGSLSSGAPIHVYDRWRASAEEVKKAAAAGVTLQEGQDTLPLVRANLEPFGADITWHQGSLNKATWEGGPIGLYVDDASKSPELWHRATKTFLPYVPVGGVLVLMDYYFFEKRGARYKAQYRWMATRGDRYEQIGDHVAGTTAAVFRRIA